MTTKQEEQLNKELGKILNRLSTQRNRISYDIYKEIKEKQENINYYLNRLVQCDE